MGFDYDYDYIFKLIVIGNQNVGKTSLFSRFIDNAFTVSYLSTIGVDFKTRTINVGQKSVKLQLWDTSGSERFQTMTSSFYRGAHGVMLVYDITNQASFDQMNVWLDNVDRYASEHVRKIMIGNKSDATRQRKVDACVAQEFADKNNMPFIETSAKNSNNVHEAFETMAKDILDNVHLLPIKQVDRDIIVVGKTKPIEAPYSYWGCCGY